MVRYPERLPENMWLNRAILPPQDEFIINLRLILHQFKKLTSRFSADYGKKARYKAIKIVFGGLACAELVLIVLSFVFPQQAHASFYTVVSSFFGGNTQEFSVKESNFNSQKMQLLQAPLNPNFSVGGGDVTIVDESALESVGTIGVDTHISPEQISLYVVRKGDTLSQIAQMFGVSRNTIIWGNDLVDGTISVGQTLVILPISGIQHIVKSGDTIESIAKKYKSDADEIRKFNEIKAGAKLALGTEIIVPDGEIAPAPVKVNIYSKTVAPASYGAPKAAPFMVSVDSGYFAKIFPAGVGRVTQGLHGYNAADVAAPMGTPILASAAGTVTVSKNSGWNGGYGNYVVISHDNNTQTLYAHMSVALAFVGARVEQGQMIGKVGSSGKSTGAHTHFEVRHAKNPYLK